MFAIRSAAVALSVLLSSVAAADDYSGQVDCVSDRFVTVVSSEGKARNFPRSVLPNAKEGMSLTADGIRDAKAEARIRARIEKARQDLEALKSGKAKVAVNAK